MDGKANVIAVEHVAIVASDVQEAVRKFTTLGFALESEERLSGQGIKSRIMRAGDARIEILENLGDEALGRFLAARGPGLHHLCLTVRSLSEAIAAAKQAGCRLVSEEPLYDSRGMRVFLHPASTNGVLIGIVEPHERG